MTGREREAEEVLAHVAAALAQHVQHRRLMGLPTPPAVLIAAAWTADCVRPRLTETGLDRLAGLLDGRHMDKLLLTKPDAAQALGVSVRTVDRLVSSGALPLVKVAGAARIRRSDLDDYVNHLAPGAA